MKIKDLVGLVAKNEGKKKQTPVGNVREIIGLISDVLFSELFNGDSETLKELYKNGSRRTKKKASK